MLTFANVHKTQSVTEADRNIVYNYLATNHSNGQTGILFRWWCLRKSRGIHDNPFDSLWDISIWTNMVGHPHSVSTAHKTDVLLYWPWSQEPLQSCSSNCSADPMDAVWIQTLHSEVLWIHSCLEHFSTTPVRIFIDSCFTHASVCTLSVRVCVCV